MAGKLGKRDKQLFINTVFSNKHLRIFGANPASVSWRLLLQTFQKVFNKPTQENIVQGPSLNQWILFCQGVTS